MRLSVVFKRLCLFASFYQVIWASEFAQDMNNLNLNYQERSEINRSPYYIPNETLGKSMNFGRKYLTLKTPSSRAEANEFSSKLERFITKITPQIWNLDGCYESARIRNYFLEVFSIYGEFKCQALRRSLIHGLLHRFKKYQQLYQFEQKNWREIGFTVVAILRVIDDLIPEVFFEVDPSSIEDAVSFAKEMSEFVALAWKIDFYPLYELLKKMNYTSIGNPEPLRLLIRKGEYLPAIKMLLTNEASIDPKINRPAWMEMIEAPESAEKNTFISTLIYLKLLDVNWTIDQGEGIEEGDVITVSLNSKHEHLQTIMTILSSEEHRPTRPLSFYLDYANDSVASHYHSRTYHKNIIDFLRDLITQSPSFKSDDRVN